MILTGNEQLIDAVQPVNWLAPLTRGMRGWWSCVPGWGGGSRLVNLCRPGEADKYGVLTTMDPPTDWRTVKGHYCLDLDGVNDHVELGVSDYVHGITGAMTWGGIYQGFDSVNNGGCILGDLGASGSRGFAIGPANDGNMYCMIAANSTTLLQANTSSGTAVNATDFFACMGVFVPSASLTSYVNGEQVAQNVTGVPSAQYTGNAISVKIGHRGDTLARLQGQLSEAWIWDRALSRAEASKWFQHSLAGYPEELNRIDDYSVIGAAANRIIRGASMTGGMYQSLTGGMVA